VGWREGCPPASRPYPPQSPRAELAPCHASAIERGGLRGGANCSRKAANGSSGDALLGARPNAPRLQRLRQLRERVELRGQPFVGCVLGRKGQGRNPSGTLYHGRKPSGDFVLTQLLARCQQRSLCDRRPIGATVLAARLSSTGPFRHPAASAASPCAASHCAG